MADVDIKVEGLDEIRRRFSQSTQKYFDALRVTLGTSLLKIWENVPPYPTANPDSTYIRTMMLAKSLGTTEGGGASTGGMRPDIYEVKVGPKMSSASFGTRLEYAPYVIGTEEQAQVHRGRWWTILDLAKKSVPGIQRIFEKFVERLARWLDGQGL